MCSTATDNHESTATHMSGQVSSNWLLRITKQLPDENGEKAEYASKRDDRKARLFTSFRGSGFPVRSRSFLIDKSSAVTLLSKIPLQPFKQPSICNRTRLVPELGRPLVHSIH